MMLQRDVVGCISEQSVHPCVKPRYFIRTPYNGVLASQTRHDYWVYVTPLATWLNRIRKNTVLF